MTTIKPGCSYRWELKTLTGSSFAVVSKASARASRPQASVRIGGGPLAVCVPERAIVKSRKHAAAFVHVGKATQPDKTIVVFEITKWTDNAYSKSFLRLNKLVFKQLDQ